MSDAATTTERWNALVAQYDAPPAEGMRRFWMSVETWREEWEASRYFIWQTGSGCDYRLAASARSDSGTSHLPERAGTLSHAELGMTEDEFERLYVSNAMVCMLVDAPDEDAAWQLVRAQFPDGIDRFCSEADDMTLEALGSGGRFGRPRPAEVVEATSPSP